eukprot:COSAG02_NODE_2883_length_7817_cov_7.827805_5_plen_58_part_00
MRAERMTAARRAWAARRSISAATTRVDVHVDVRPGSPRTLGHAGRAHVRTSVVGIST